MLVGECPTDTETPTHYIVRPIDTPGPIKIVLSDAAYATKQGVENGPWCLQAHRSTAREVLQTCDDALGAELAPPSKQL